MLRVRHHRLKNLIIKYKPNILTAFFSPDMCGVNYNISVLNIQLILLAQLNLFFIQPGPKNLPRRD